MLITTDKKMYYEWYKRIKIFPNYYNGVDIVMFFGGEPILSFDTIVVVVDKFKLLYENNLIKKYQDTIL